MSSERECFVYIVLPGATEFVTAGRVRVATGPTGDPVAAFVYGRRYRELADAVELDPVELRLAGHVYETGRMGGFFGAIRDAMPDSWGRRVIERHVGATQLEEFDYLLRGPDDRAGALSFRPTVEPPVSMPRFADVLELDRLQIAADAVVAGEPHRAASAGAQVEELLWPGTSLGGARPKAVVQDADGLWIAKFGSRNDRWNHPRVEHGTLALARACGLQVADSRMETFADRDVLLVRRFDRERSDSGYRRHRMVSALTLLQAGDSNVDRANWSYLLLADEVRRASPHPRTDLDADRDGIFLAGELVECVLALTNAGLIRSDSLHVSLRSADAGVVIAQQTTSYPAIGADKTTWGPGSIGYPRFSFDPEITDGHTAEFTLEVAMGDEIVRRHALRATGSSAKVEIEQVAVIDSAGNGDGRVQRGEFVRLGLTLASKRPEFFALATFSLRPVDERGDAGGGA